MLTYSVWESFVKKLIALSLFLLALVSCSSAVQQIPTAMATREALTTVVPAETLQALPSSVATLEALGSAVPDSGDILNPQGNPAQEWRGIPIMPEAIAGQEMTVNNVYSFRANASAQDVQAFYEDQLTQLGWSQPFDSSFDENGGTLTFRKAGSSLAIKVTPSADFVVVVLVMTLA